MSVLHPDCPEEYTEVVQESKNLANEFTEEVGGQSPSLVPQLTLQLDVKVRWGPCLAVTSLVPQPTC